MRVQDIVNMNAKLVPKQSKIITIIVIMLNVIAIEFAHVIVAGIGLLISLVLALLFLTISPLNYIFNKSVFGEYAYQYMSVPIPFKVLVKGKVLTAFTYCSTLLLIVMICVWFLMVHFFSSGGVIYSSIIENSAIALINMHELLSENMISTESIVFIIGVSAIAVLIEALFISAGIFYAVIIRNIVEPQRAKVTIAIGVAFAAAIIYIVFTFLCIWLPGLFFRNDLAIAQLIIAAVLKAGAAYGIMVHSAKLLETKYSLN